MRRLGCSAILLMISTLMSAGAASATTYYIAANGSDTNSGTSKSSPWLHAPGMSGCSGTCSSAAPKPGDSFILRGGDTWHYSSVAGSPVGTPWTWSASGSSTSCNLDARLGAVVKTSCIYIGTDHTWYVGPSYARPILNFDNPLSTSYVSSCAYNQNGQNLIRISANYVIFDDFEILGFCWNSSGGVVFSTASTGVEMSNMYFHGWTTVSGETDGFYMMEGSLALTSFQLCDHNVFDGTDATEGNLPLNATGFAIDQNCTEIADNVFHHLSNGVISNMQLVHDNLFENLYEPNDTGTHGNIVEWDNPRYSSPVLLAFYNNIMHDTNEGEGVNVAMITSNALFFNNVSWLYRETSSHTNGSQGANCYQLSLQAAGPSEVNFFNNTSDAPCTYTGQTTGYTSAFQNNHMIGYSSLSNFISYYGSGSGVVTDNGSEIFQSESAASTQGYGPANAYAPTSNTNATVGQGANLTPLCISIGVASLTAACEGSAPTIAEVPGEGGYVVSVIPGNVRPSSGAWDAGAYEFSAVASGPPGTPPGLSDVVR